MVLQNNGGGSQDVAANSTSFQYTQLSNGSAYAITVQTLPSGAICTVANGSGTISGANVNNVSITCTSTNAANAVPISVNPGPASSGNQTFNDLLASVTVCQPGTQTCVTIDNVLVDTGSEGLRLMKSVLASKGLALTPMPDPNNNANTIHECLPFADGYTWGTVALAGVNLSGESAASVPIQIIDDGAPPNPVAPGTCASNGTSLNSVDAFDSNGILGVGVFVQDCGSSCANNVYYSCTGGGTCTSVTLATANQVSNPVASFADNNGVMVQLQSIPSSGAATASGVLVFGIGTQSNNKLGSATVLTTDGNGYMTTMFNNQSLTSSFIDSGSNALFFPAGNGSPLTVCTSSNMFYCPGSSASISTQNLTATNQGANNASTNVDFQVANLDYLAANYGSNYALNNVGGPAVKFNNVSNYFDWGLPFFYGKIVYFAIEGIPPPAGGTPGPYFAY
jgi:hypothetical protein